MADAEEDTTAAEHATPADRAVVAGQLGRLPRALCGIACRCPYGMPAVTRQAPRDDAGTPFPTGFYVTCPSLVRQVDRLEAAGGVRRHEQQMSKDPALHAATERAHAEHRRLHGTSIAGMADTARVKCLHAHAAVALAGIDHPLGRQVLREAQPAWCADGRCLSLVPAEGDGDA